MKWFVAGMMLALLSLALYGWLSVGIPHVQRANPQYNTGVK